VSVDDGAADGTDGDVRPAGADGDVRPAGAEDGGAVGRAAGGAEGSAFAALVVQFDEWFDRALDVVRGHPVPDRIFYAASDLGDWSALWHAISAGRAAAHPDRLGESVRLSATLGLESLLVNQGVKRLFKRHRPAFEGTRPHRLRTPSTTSFPSGHASAAFCAAALLSDHRSPTARLWYGLAVVVALSRPYVRIHHASDMVGGAIAGYAIGRIVRAVWTV
jgi:undecaprenyl-diphosphatase